MARLWRITRRRFLDSALSGEGARIYGGRWNAVGTPVVYLATTRSLAVLEMLVQTRDPDQLAEAVLIPVDVEPEPEPAGTLPPDWRAVPAPPSVAALGSAWAASGRSLLLDIPSAVLPAERNRLLNPLHPDAAHVQPGTPEDLDLDPRLLRR